MFENDINSSFNIILDQNNPTKTNKQTNKQMNYTKIQYSVFKTMDTGVLTTQTMAAADKDVEWVKVQIIAVSFILILLLSGWLTDSVINEIGFSFLLSIECFFSFHVCFSFKFSPCTNNSSNCNLNICVLACSISQSIYLMIVCLLVYIVT